QWSLMITGTARETNRGNDCMVLLLRQAGRYRKMSLNNTANEPYNQVKLPAAECLPLLQAHR
ncbi:TPA: hypothetical protein ACWP82_005852, partial [Klebsiella pneumoniae]